MKKIILASIMLCLCAEGMHKTPWNISKLVRRLNVAPVAQESSVATTQIIDETLQAAIELNRKTADLIEKLNRMKEQLIDAAKYFGVKEEEAAALKARYCNPGSKNPTTSISAKLSALARATRKNATTAKESRGLVRPSEINSHSDDDSITEPENVSLQSSPQMKRIQPNASEKKEHSPRKRPRKSK